MTFLYPFLTQIFWILWIFWNSDLGNWTCVKSTHMWFGYSGFFKAWQFAYLSHTDILYIPDFLDLRFWELYLCQKLKQIIWIFWIFKVWHFCIHIAHRYSGYSGFFGSWIWEIGLVWKVHTNYLDIPDFLKFDIFVSLSQRYSGYSGFFGSWIWKIGLESKVHTLIICIFRIF